MATSYNGWPASPDKNEIGIEKFGDAAGFPFPGGVKSGDVFTVLGYVMTQLHERVEECVQGWCWGYTYKQNVNNPSQLSCHASGTACDWNAPNHPNGSSGTFTDTQVGIIYTILAEVEGAVSWLQGYDEMHFEICVDAATLAGVAARLGTTPPPSSDWFDTVTKDEMLALLDPMNKAIKDLQNKVGFLHSNELIPRADGSNYPYTKSAANFNDTRALDDKVEAVAKQVDFIYRNELIPREDGSNYPYTKSAANFNDTRAIAVNVQTLVDNNG
jgi:hypothetical protein